MIRIVNFVHHYQMYCFGIATGFIAGDLGGTVTPILAIFDVYGATIGTNYSLWMREGKLMHGHRLMRGVTHHQ